MPDIAQLVTSLGRMAQKKQLVRRGARDLDLTRAVRSGEVIRVRNGWYSTLAEHSPELRAVRVGGRLTGISAVIARGGWVLGRHPLHVAVNENAARLRTQQNRHKRIDVRNPRGVVLHWADKEQCERGSAVSVGLLDALAQVVLDQDFETAVAALDWALHTGALDLIDLETLILRLPAELRGIRNWVDTDCDSLPESLARTRLRLAGHAVRSQVPMSGGRSIDLVVDEIAGIEVDGEGTHLTKFESDRAKDVDITLMGLHALRPTARMVFHNWDHFARSVEVAVSLHRRSTASSGNSGSRVGSLFNSRGMSGWRRRDARRSPEFPKGGGEGGRDGGNKWARGSGWVLRE